MILITAARPLAAAVTLGTNDNFGLNLETNNITVASFTNGGAALFKNASDSTTGFQAQNSAGVNLLQIDTTTDSANLVTNGSFEVNTTGWTAEGAATVSRVTTQQYIGLATGQAATTAAAHDGIKYSYALASTTQ